MITFLNLIKNKTGKPRIKFEIRGILRKHFAKCSEQYLNNKLNVNILLHIFINIRLLYVNIMLHIFINIRFQISNYRHLGQAKTEFGQNNYNSIEYNTNSQEF